MFNLAHSRYSNSLAGLVVLAASFLFSLQLIVQKLATANGVSVVSVVVGSFFVVGLCLMPVSLRPTSLRIKPFEYFGLTLLACARLGAMSCYFISLELLPASNAVLMFYLAPLFLLAQMALAGYERIRPFHAIVFSMAFGGMIIALNVSHSNNITGYVSGIAAGLIYSWDFILTKRFIPKGRALASYSLCCLLITLIVVLIAVGVKLVVPEQLPDITQEYILLSLALTPLILFPYFLLAIAIQIIGASRAALYTLSEPVLVIFLAVIIGWEALSLHMVAGASMVIVALLLLYIIKDNSVNSLHS